MDIPDVVQDFSYGIEVSIICTVLVFKHVFKMINNLSTVQRIDISRPACVICEFAIEYLSTR